MPGCCDLAVTSFIRHAYPRFIDKYGVPRLTKVGTCTRRPLLTSKINSTSPQERLVSCSNVRLNRTRNRRAPPRRLRRVAPIPPAFLALPPHRPPRLAAAFYEVLISRAGRAQETYRVASCESVLVPWPSSPLSSREVAAIRVRAAGQDGSTTA